MSKLTIESVQAFATSFPVNDGVTLGIGRAVKRDAVIVKVVAGGITGWGEAHHGRCPGAIAHLINTTLRQLVTGMDASDTVGVWNKVYRMQLASHGMGAAAALALSGIDLALWDIRGKAVGWPVYKLLGGAARDVPAYAGGISLGYQPPKELVAEAAKFVAQGYRALKLRVGDRPDRDLMRVQAVREAFGDDITILVDANTGYRVEDVRQVMPGFEEAGVGWLEEPFPPHDYHSYGLAARFGSVPLAAGENHFTRFEFNRVLEDGYITVLQPDMSKCGGITEGLRIAAMASAYKLPVHPHTSSSGLNMVASIHFLCGVDNPGYFEGDTSKGNLFRDALTSTPFVVDAQGCVRPPEGPGLGVSVDEDFLTKHPVIDGPAYV